MEQHSGVPIELRYEEKEAYNKRYLHPNLGSKSAKGLLCGYTREVAGRLTTTTYQINDKSEVILASNSYDELGRLITKQRHNGVDNETYEYNIRNQTTRITSGDFEQKLYYNSLPSSMPEGLACYNGNISCSTWTYGNEPARAYTYYYDNLNRYTSSYAYMNDNLLVNHEYTEQFQYDKMENINQLSRYGNQQTHDLDHLVLSCLCTLV